MLGSPRPPGMCEGGVASSLHSPLLRRLVLSGPNSRSLSCSQSPTLLLQPHCQWPECPLPWGGGLAAQSPPPGPRDPLPKLGTASAPQDGRADTRWHQQEASFNPWVGKILWRKERLPTPIFWPEEFHGLYNPWGCKELDTTGRLPLSLFTLM